MTIVSSANCLHLGFAAAEAICLLFVTVKVSLTLFLVCDTLVKVSRTVWITWLAVVEVFATLLQIRCAVWIPRFAIAEILLTLLKVCSTIRVARFDVFEIAATVIEVFCQLCRIRRVNQDEAHSSRLGILQLPFTTCEPGICRSFQMHANTARIGTAEVYTLYRSGGLACVLADIQVTVDSELFVLESDDFIV